MLFDDHNMFTVQCSIFGNNFKTFHLDMKKKSTNISLNQAMKNSFLSFLILLRKASDYANCHHELFSIIINKLNEQRKRAIRPASTPISLSLTRIT